MILYFSTSVIHSSTEFLMLLILFLCLLTMVVTWKNSIFLSPYIAQFNWDFNVQYHSSCLLIRAYSSMRSFSSCTRNSLGWLAKAFWAPLSLAMTLFFLLKMLPNTSTFHYLAFLVKLVIASERAWSWSQLSLTNLGNSGCISHIVWNLKGLFEHMGGGLASSRRTRQWSMKTRGRWVTKALEKQSSKIGFQNSNQFSPKSVQWLA